MSFLTIVEKVGHEVVTFGPLATSMLGIAYPPAGALANVILTSVIKAEQIAEANKTEKAGVAKKAMVMADINAALPLLQAGLGVGGKQLEVTPEFTAAISTIIDAVVAQLSGLAVIKSAIK